MAFFTTIGQFISGYLARLAFNSFGIENVTRSIVLKYTFVYFIRSRRFKSKRAALRQTA